MPRSDREVLEEALGYQRLTQGMQGRIARVLRGGVDDLLDRMCDLCSRYGREIGDPAGAARWLSSMWGPYDEEWLSKYADSLPEPLRGRWEAVLRAPRFDRAISRRKAMAYASRMCMDRIEHGVKEVSGPPLGRVAREAAMRTAHQVQTSAGVGFSFELPNQGQIERVMSSAGISKQIKGFSQANVELVEDRVVRGLLAGASIDDIAAGIRRDFKDMSPARARRIARTMTTDCAAEAKLREYGELGVEEYEIMCTLDERTCPTCGSMDGKAFPVKGSHPRPSFHPNCRCVIVERLPKDWTEKMTRAARDERGRTVQAPRSMTYEEWKDRFARPANGQGGPAKAKAVKKASRPAQGKKARQKAPTAPGSGNPTEAQAQPVQKANESAQNPAGGPTVSKTETVYAGNLGTQASKDPYSAPPTRDEWDAMNEDGRKSAVVRKAEDIKTAPRPCTGFKIEDTDKAKTLRLRDSYGVDSGFDVCPDGSTQDLAASTNSMVLDGRITTDMADSLYHYTTEDGYKAMNHPLFRTEGGAEDLANGAYPEFFERSVRDIENIDAAIALSETKAPMVVHRGMSGSPFPGLAYSDINEHSMGGNTELPNFAFTSTSIDYQVAKDFAEQRNGGRDKLMVHYNVPQSKGVGIYIGDGAERLNGQPLSEWPEETEFLMKRGLKAVVYDYFEDDEGIKHVFVDVVVDADLRGDGT